jgi:hypothetical protein
MTAAQGRLYRLEEGDLTKLSGKSKQELARGARKAEWPEELSRERTLPMLDPKHDPFIEQVKADLAEGQAELDRGERIPWHEVLANLEADAQQRMAERDNQPPI